MYHVFFIHSSVDGYLGCFHLGKVMYTLLDLKWITNKDLLYSTGNSA